MTFPCPNCGRHQWDEMQHHHPHTVRAYCLNCRLIVDFNTTHMIEKGQQITLFEHEAQGAA